MKKIIITLFLSLLFFQHSFAEEEFLSPEVAFALSEVKVTEGQDGQHQLNVTWKIADGYYMYKNKVSFLTDNTAIELGQPTLPAGKEKDDEFFGRIEIYKKQFTAQLPVSSSLTNQELSITAKTQGCAEAGICYPPFRQTVTFKLPSAPVAAATKVNNSPTQVLDSMLGDSSSMGMDEEEEFLPPEEAFKLNVEVDADGKLMAYWQVAEGYYLYRNKFKFELLGNPSVSLGAVQFPKGKMKTDDILGTYEVYYKAVAAQLPIVGTVNRDKPLDIKITYQGCAEAGLCYPLTKKSLSVNVGDIKTSTGGGTVAAASEPQDPPAAASQSTAPVLKESEQVVLADYLKESNAILILATFFGLGLALAFTPCVFPMIPILSGIIAGQGSNIDTRKAFMMSVVYVLAMAITYTLAGVFAGLSGENIQIWFQNPWVLSSFALIFILLALSMFGFYELQLPSSLQSKMTELSNKQKGGDFGGVAIMGFLSALIVGPCVAPPLMGALIYISQTGDPFIGGGALFAMSMGMGIPLIAIGTSAGKFLPRAGVWMDNVKAAFGVLMLGVAIWMMERVLPAAVIMALWATLLIFSAVYLGALTPITEATTGWGKFRKSTAIVLFLYGISLIIGALAGNNDMFQPLKGLGGSHVVASQQAEAGHVEFQRVKNVQELEQRISQAKSEGKPVMLDFYADWCISCKEMEKFTFSDPTVGKTMGNFVLLQADVTDDNEENKALLKYYNLFGPPAIIFYSTQGEEVENFRLVGYKEAKAFDAHLKQFLQL